MNSDADILLDVSGLTKRYAVTVLDECALQVRAGAIHALIGANGAGKSTLCKIIAGLIPATAGSMTLDSKPYSPTNKQSAEAAGVQIVQQELNLIPTLSVAENLRLTRLPTWGGMIRQRELHRLARATLDRFGLEDIDTLAPAGSLGVGRQQMIEIATALDRDCKLMILDEPTAALSAGETETLFEWLRELREQGVGVIYISHRLDEVSALADRVTILRDGKKVRTANTNELTTDEMIGLMSGETAAHSTERKAPTNQPVAMRVESASRGFVRDVSFTVHRGERLGIAGLVGSGRTELLRTIFGADTAESGNVYLGHSPTPLRFRHPSEAVAVGLAMVTEDRKQNGLLLSQSIRANTTLSSMWERFSNNGVIRRRAEEETAQSMSQSLQTQSTGIEQTVDTLSGGNQQKVAVAKWLVRDADVFLFDEPTRGIDVAARRRIYRLMDSLTDAGKAIVIVSSDLDELLETCDRIAVMSDGRLIETFTRPDWSPDRIMQAAFSNYVMREPA